MPTVPVYGAPQEQLRPAPTPQLDTVASPEILGAEARQRGELAKGLLSAGTGAAAVFTVLQERENADLVFRAETALKDNWLKYEREVRESRRGRGAKGVTRDTEQ